jgi:hypothetical protein
LLNKLNLDCPKTKFKLPIKIQALDDRDGMRMKTELSVDVLFLYRYVYDDENDIVNLQQDVLDLEVFPERLEGSYIFEWQKYVRREAHKQNFKTSEESAKNLLSKLEKTRLTEYLKLQRIIEKAQQINQSKNVKVIKTPFRTYIESLLTI